MTWIIKKLYNIPLEALDVGFKRFKGVKMHLIELFDYNTMQVMYFFKDCKTVLDAINRVLVGIKYPFTITGKPTDYHYYQAFRKTLGICWKSFKNEYDFWQKASETAWLGYGDCEDSSILLHAYLVSIGVDSFCVFGIVYVKKLNKLKLLGGHAFVIAKIDGEYRLIETTLERSIPKITYFPIVNIQKTQWNWGKLLYEGVFMLHNLDELWFNSKYYSNEELKEFTMKNIYEKYTRIGKKMRRKEIIEIRLNWENMENIVKQIEETVGKIERKDN